MDSKRPASRHDELRKSANSPQDVIESAKLLGRRTVIEIRHNGEVYRLRITKGGKLILTK